MRFPQESQRLWTGVRGRRALQARLGMHWGKWEAVWGLIGARWGGDFWQFGGGEQVVDCCGGGISSVIMGRRVRGREWGER
jgi:hypothetical protein